MGSRGWASHCSECDQTSFCFGRCRTCLRYTFVLRGTDKEDGKASNQKWPNLFHRCSLSRPPRSKAFRNARSSPVRVVCHEYRPPNPRCPTVPQLKKPPSSHAIRTSS